MIKYTETAILPQVCERQLNASVVKVLYDVCTSKLGIFRTHSDNVTTSEVPLYQQHVLDRSAQLTCIKPMKTLSIDTIYHSKL